MDFSKLKASIRSLTATVAVVDYVCAPAMWLCYTCTCTRSLTATVAVVDYAMCTCIASPTLIQNLGNTYQHYTHTHTHTLAT